jgi:hypothetical protein
MAQLSLPETPTVLLLPSVGPILPLLLLQMLLLLLLPLLLLPLLCAPSSC